MNTVIKKSLQSLLLVPIIALGMSVVVQPSAAFAQDGFTGGVSGGMAATGQAKETVHPKGIVTQIVNVLLFVVGAASIIMIIWGGIKYITSGGDSAGVTSAKNTILYAVIGLIVAVLAYTLVNFVLTDLLNGIAPANP